MKICRFLKFRIYPNKEQKELINKTFNCCRYIYNHMLSRQIKIYKRRKEHLSCYEMQKLLPTMKKYLLWLNEVDSHALRWECDKLDKAYKMFFRKNNKFPKFKSKKKQPYCSYITMQSYVCFNDSFIKLPVLRNVKHNETRKLNGTIKYVTISKKNDKYYCSICYECEKEIIPIGVHKDNVIGFDYKSDGLYMDSNGNCIGSPKFFRKSQKNLARKQRQFSKMVKGSNNYNKKLKQIRNIYEHIANQRREFLHNLSTEIANQYDAVCIEDLSMKSIGNKSFGNGKATFDNGWYMFTEMLFYKLFDKGKQLIKIDKWYPSTKTCSVCGNIQDMKLSDRKYVCKCCDTVIDRDYNAAINIRNEGLRILKVS